MYIRELEAARPSLQGLRSQSVNEVGEVGSIGFWPVNAISCYWKGSQIDIQTAARLNRKLGLRLGFKKHIGRIARLLSLPVNPTDHELATAVARWQCLKGLEVDGILGRVSWSQLRPLDLAPHPLVSKLFPRNSPGLVSYRDWPQQYARAETIQALQTIGVSWNRSHPQGPRIGIGEMSLRGGGPIRGHKSHQKGLDIDMRPVRNDGKEGGVRYQESRYSRQLTRELVNLLRANHVLRVKFIFFNDKRIRHVREWPNHDDHLHVRFHPPGAP